MEGKYFFNGKDISMNLYIQIRDVVDIGGREFARAVVEIITAIFRSGFLRGGRFGCVRFDAATAAAGREA